jgi:glycerol-3-phosphate dehydrogenase
MVMRRTQIGLFGPPPIEVCQRIARQMGKHLGWDEARQTHEIESLAPLYQVAP